MNINSWTGSIVIATLFFPIAAVAQDPDEMTRAERRAYFASLPADERQAEREAAKARWDSMSDAERQAKREERQAQREARRTQWESMSEEERQAMRAEMRAKRDAMTPEERRSQKRRSHLRR